MKISSNSMGRRFFRESNPTIYDTQSQMDIQKQFSAGARNGIHWPYLHAPFFTVLSMPLSWFSYVGAFWLWTLFTTTLYFVSVVLLNPLGAT